MPYRLSPGVHLVCVKNRYGKVDYHYSRKPFGRATFGPIIPWLSDEQAAYLLRTGMVERIDHNPAKPAGHEAEKAPAVERTSRNPHEENADLILREAVRNGIDPDRVHTCIQAIAELDLPLNTGAPKVRAALRTSGHRFENLVVAIAVKARRQSALSRTAS